MLQELILKYGKEKINTLTKYPSILTLHKFANRGKFSDALTTDIQEEILFASEKIDGTNVRLIFWGDEFLIGSRKCILHYSKDLYWDEALGIVNQFYALNIPLLQPDKLTVVYGELFGGKITANSKNYGKDKHGFRVFDIAVLDDLSILEEPIAAISHWREHSADSSVDERLQYGQNFVDVDALSTYGYDLVPNVEFPPLPNLEHATILDALQQHAATTQVALSDTAKGKTEGVILRNFDRSTIVKLRFEDYERTLKKR
ncbi:MAG: RNA ligase family protein [Aureispira sp.]